MKNLRFEIKRVGNLSCVVRLLDRFLQMVVFSKNNPKGLDPRIKIIGRAITPSYKETDTASDFSCQLFRP